MTKLGIKNNVMAMLMCIVALASGYVGALLLAGYILLVETDSSLRKTTVKVIVIMGVASLAVAVIGLLPDVIAWISDFLSLFKGSLYIGFLSQLCAVLSGAVRLCETVILLVMALSAYKGKEFSNKALDDVAASSMGYETADDPTTTVHSAPPTVENTDSNGVNMFK